MSSGQLPTSFDPETHEIDDQIDPSFLSQVSETFQERMTTLLSDQVRSGSTYKDVFTGRNAVDQLALILNTTDRNLALLVGRSLYAQDLFSDVTQAHHALEDSEELYRFDGGLEEEVVPEEKSRDKSANATGVWTLLTNCYSPSCSKDTGCYSCLCPHGTTVEQQSWF